MDVILPGDPGSTRATSGLPNLSNELKIDALLSNLCKMSLQRNQQQLHVSDGNAKSEHDKRSKYKAMLNMAFISIIDHDDHFILEIDTTENTL